MLLPVSEVADMQTRLGPARRFVDPDFQHSRHDYVGFVRELVKAGSVEFVGTTVGPRTCQALLYLAIFFFDRAAICRTHNVQIREPIYKKMHFCDVQISFGRKSIKNGCRKSMMGC